MSRNAQRINRQRGWGHPVLGLLAAVWLNLALQPCAMAAEADHDCPHCPPAHEHAMTSHHGHGEMQKQKQAPCASLDAPCGELEDASVDGRAGQPKTKDAGEVSAAITVEPTAGEFHRYRTAALPTGPPVVAGASTPLYVLNCAYLK